MVFPKPILAALLLIPCSPASAAVAVERTEYKHWQDAWMIRNGTCEMVIVPQVGRVMYFGLTGGSNVLWNNDALAGQVVLKDDGTWHNFGGDKVWPTEQDWWERYTDRKGWPPPYFSDAAPQTAEPIPGGVRMISPRSPEFGTRTIREFVMDAAKPIVHLRQWFKKENGKPVMMTLWSVTQVRKPDYAILPTGRDIDGKPVRELGKVVRSTIESGARFVSIRNDPQEPQKIGTAPDEARAGDWVGAVFGAELFVESRAVGSDSAYPDGNCQGELYTAPARDGSYVELEMLSPMRELKAGETLRDDAIWQIVRLDRAVRGPDTAAQIARASHARVLQRLSAAKR